MNSIITQIRQVFNGPTFDRFFLLAIFILTTLVAFFAGRTLKFLENRPAFYFESTERVSDDATTQDFQNLVADNVNVDTIVASKGGKKYYFVWCTGASNIKEKNKRYFKNEEAAQKAGYTKAASCK